MFAGEVLVALFKKGKATLAV